MAGVGWIAGVPPQLHGLPPIGIQVLTMPAVDHTMLTAAVTICDKSCANTECRGCSEVKAEREVSIHNRDWRKAEIHRPMCPQTPAGLHLLMLTNVHNFSIWAIYMQVEELYILPCEIHPSAQIVGAYTN